MARRKVRLRHFRRPGTGAVGIDAVEGDGTEPRRLARAHRQAGVRDVPDDVDERVARHGRVRVAGVGQRLARGLLALVALVLVEGGAGRQREPNGRSQRVLRGGGQPVQPVDRQAAVDRRRPLFDDDLDAHVSRDPCSERARRARARRSTRARGSTARCARGPAAGSRGRRPRSRRRRRERGRETWGWPRSRSRRRRRPRRARSSRGP